MSLDLETANQLHRGHAVCTLCIQSQTTENTSHMTLHHTDSVWTQWKWRWWWWWGGQGRVNALTRGGGSWRWGFCNLFTCCQPPSFGEQKGLSEEEVVGERRKQGDWWGWVAALATKHSSSITKLTLRHRVRANWPRWERSGQSGGGQRRKTPGD